ncbi:MAG: hypothetical protein AMXMBFR47_36890 [Planctomycetota bacterium]
MNEGTSDPAATTGPNSTRRYRIAGAAFLLLLVGWVGSPGLGSTWLQGDERIFIVNNPEVTGADGKATLPARVARLFTHAHEDLYQPVPLATYAIQWELGGGEASVWSIRLVDVLLHAANALLLWAVAALLLQTILGLAGGTATLLGFGIALIWAVHPALAPAYAADMGRTHLLSFGFALASILLHRRALESKHLAATIGMFACVALAMMSKVIPAWFLVVFALEAAWRGSGPALRSPRVYATLVLCALFAWINISSTRAAGLLEDTGVGLFGDPVSRSLVALAIYCEHAFAPIRLSTWYPPDIDTGWGYWRTWLGLVAAVVILGAIVACARGRMSRITSVGLAWFAVTLLPVLGVVGARAAAAQDRYLYLPLAGLLIGVIGGLAVLAERRRAAASVARSLVGILALVAALLAFESFFNVLDARDMLARAERALARDANDPRLREFVAMAHSHARDYPEARPADWSPADAEQRFLAKLHEAAAAIDAGSAYFAGSEDQAAARRRLSWQYFKNRMFRESLDQARAAETLSPHAPMTLYRLAQTYQAIGDWRSELQALLQLERNLPEDPQFRADVLTELGSSLLMVFDQPAAALERLRRAMATGRGRALTRVRLARAEVLAGQGVRGFEIAQGVLLENPENFDAATVIALYHARSEHWDEADRVCRILLSREPTNYEILRIFSEVCMQRGAMEDAMVAWRDAVRLDPETVGYRSFFVWSAACADAAETEQWIAELLEKNPGDRFAMLARMMLSLKAGRVDEAVDWVRKAAEGPALVKANELARAERTLFGMQKRDERGPEADVVRAALLMAMQRGEEARALVDAFVRDNAESPWVALARSIAASPASSQAATDR